jgi:hypothetical protein
MPSANIRTFHQFLRQLVVSLWWWGCHWHSKMRLPVKRWWWNMVPGDGGGEGNQTWLDALRHWYGGSIGGKFASSMTIWWLSWRMMNRLWGGCADDASSFLFRLGRLSPRIDPSSAMAPALAMVVGRREEIPSNWQIRWSFLKQVLFLWLWASHFLFPRESTAKSKTGRISRWTLGHHRATAAKKWRWWVWQLWNFIGMGLVQTLQKKSNEQEKFFLVEICPSQADLGLDNGLNGTGIRWQRAFGVDGVDGFGVAFGVGTLVLSLWSHAFGVGCWCRLLGSCHLWRFHWVNAFGVGFFESVPLSCLSGNAVGGNSFGDETPCRRTLWRGYQLWSCLLLSICSRFTLLA